MKQEYKDEMEGLIRWQKDHTENPGDDLTGCLHCELSDMANWDVEPEVTALQEPIKSLIARTDIFAIPHIAVSVGQSPLENVWDTL